MHGINVRLVSRFLQHLLQSKPVGIAVDLVAQAAGEIRECLQFLGLGRRVHPAQERRAQACQLPGHRLVGGEHEFLNDLMADVVLDKMGALDAALIVQIELGFRHAELDGAALEPAAAQDHGQVAHAQEQGQDLRFYLGARSLGIGQDGRHLLIREPPRHADGGIGKVRPGPLPREREIHERTLHVAHPPPLQARQAVRDDLGKHGQYAAGQIDARAALSRLPVERTPRRSKVANVGDVHAQLPVLALRVHGQRNGIVEVAGICGVDGDDDLLRKVLAAVEVILVKRGRGLACFLEHVLRKFVGQAKRPDNGQRVHSRRAARAENFGDHPFAAVLGRGEAQHLEDDLVPSAHALGARVADINAVAEHGAVYADESLALALVIGADELARGALEHAHDFARRAQPRPVGLARDPHQDLIARGRIERVVAADVDLGNAMPVDHVRPDEAVAARQPAKDAGHRPVRLDGAYRVIAADLQALLGDQAAQRVLESAVLRTGNLELPRQSLRLERMISLASDRGQDLFFQVGHERRWEFDRERESEKSRSNQGREPVLVRYELPRGGSRRGVRCSCSGERRDVDEILAATLRALDRKLLVGVHGADGVERVLQPVAAVPQTRERGRLHDAGFPGRLAIRRLGDRADRVDDGDVAEVRPDHHVVGLHVLELGPALRLRRERADIRVRGQRRPDRPGVVADEAVAVQADVVVAILGHAQFDVEALVVQLVMGDQGQRQGDVVGPALAHVDQGDARLGVLHVLRQGVEYARLHEEQRRPRVSGAGGLDL